MCERCDAARHGRPTGRRAGGRGEGGGRRVCEGGGWQNDEEEGSGGTPTPPPHPLPLPLQVHWSAYTAKPLQPCVLDIRFTCSVYLHLVRRQAQMGPFPVCRSAETLLFLTTVTTVRPSCKSHTTNFSSPNPARNLTLSRPRILTKHHTNANSSRVGRWLRCGCV